MVLNAVRTAARLAAVAVAALIVSACGSPPGAVAQGSKATPFTGVWVAVGTFEDPAGPPPWSNTLWPDEPPFTAWGEAESRRLADIRNVVPCQPGGPIFAMWEL